MFLMTDACMPHALAATVMHPNAGKAGAPFGPAEPKRELKNR